MATPAAALPILYHYYRSSSSWRVRWALEIKGLAYTAIAVNLLKSEQQQESYLAKNPLGLVPALELDVDERGDEPRRLRRPCPQVPKWSRHPLHSAPWAAELQRQPAWLLAQRPSSAELPQRPSTGALHSRPAISNLLVSSSDP